MRHRGPDGEGVVVAGNWRLLHQRLSIIDTSDAGSQPMLRDGNVLVFNGEIYNYKELREQYMPQAEYKSHSDTEVLLSLLNKYGMSILNKLNGMFAFAWYNSFEDKLYIARDRYGVKPVYYYRYGERFYFASEVKSLLQVMKTAPSIDASILDDYYAYTATDFDARTFYKDVAQVEAGHYIQVSGTGSVSDHTWYRGSDFYIDEGVLQNYRGTVEYFEDLLTDAIKLRNRADVPVAMTLSGGLDSTTLYVLNKEKLHFDITPFTLSHNGARTDEYGKVKRLVESYGDNVHKIIDTEYDMQELFASMKTIEYPIWNISSVGYAQVYSAIHQNGFKCVIEGQGSDELLGGYAYMVEAASHQAFLNRDFQLSYDLYKMAQLVQTVGVTPETQSYCKKFVIDQLRKSGLNKHLSSIPGFIKNILIKDEDYFSSVMDEAFSYKILPIELRNNDRIPMSCSIESRLPFLDYRVVETAKAMPLNSKCNRLGSKAVLREILKKYGKSYIYEEKCKMGFASNVPAFMNKKENRAVFIEYVKRAKGFPKQYKQDEYIDKLQQGKVSWNDTMGIYKLFAIPWYQEWLKRGLNIHSPNKW